MSLNSCFRECADASVGPACETLPFTTSVNAFLGVLSDRGFHFRLMSGPCSFRGGGPAGQAPGPGLPSCQQLCRLRCGGSHASSPPPEHLPEEAASARRLPRGRSVIYPWCFIPLCEKTRSDAVFQIFFFFIINIAIFSGVLRYEWYVCRNMSVST